MEKWSLEETHGQLRLVPRRSLGSDRFTWAHLLYGRLGPVQVCVIYFPSRFNSPVDQTVIDLLRTFGTNTGPSTCQCLGYHRSQLWQGARPVRSQVPSCPGSCHWPTAQRHRLSWA
jgi:hypothetical protein